MAKTEHPLQALADWLPEDSFEKAAYYLKQYKVHLTITRKRKTVLGDYRNATRLKNHRISVNGNLNKYEFLITLIHELAHLLTYEQYSYSIQPHGIEWKKIYSRLLSTFIGQNIFPDDVELILKQSLNRPAASSCAETDLIRVLRRYDTKQENEDWVFVENIPAGAVFEMRNRKKFIKGERLRKRFMCTEITTKHKYLFNPLCEVRVVKE